LFGGGAERPKQTAEGAPAGVLVPAE
jgi:hypothetical protein